MAKKLKLLIVDDSNVVRRKIQRGHNDVVFNVVGCAANGAEAVEQFSQLQPDVVTMDITMPHMDGIECITRLMDLDPGVRILVISALSDKRTGIEALERGASGFLTKPFNDQQLSEALNDLIEV